MNRKRKVSYFTSEAVSAGHPDKICDQISDALLDYCITYDKESRIAIECLVTENLLVIAGEIRTNAILNKIGWTIVYIMLIFYTIYFFIFNNFFFCFPFPIIISL